MRDGEERKGPSLKASNLIRSHPRLNKRVVEKKWKKYTTEQRVTGQGREEERERERNDDDLDWKEKSLFKLVPLF